jgi:hypothetical protein
MEDELRKIHRIKELEKELRELKGGDSESIIYTERGEYKGHPILTIYGPFRPFSLGISKGKAILSVIEDIKGFVNSEGNRLL